MDRIFKGILIFLVVFFSLGAVLVNRTKGVDVNEDGNPDVIYHHDGENITKISADTNYDGAPDVVVYIEEEKFKSAEVDTDFDGKPDKTINDSAQFKEWVNENRPDFNNSLGWDDYSRKISKVFWKPGEDD